MKKDIPKELITKTKAWLREEGLQFFKDIKKEHGVIDAVYAEGEIIESMGFQKYSNRYISSFIAVLVIGFFAFFIKSIAELISSDFPEA